MVLSLYADKYELVLKNLLSWSKWAANPIKYDGRAQGASFMFLTREQNRNILMYLQDHDKVIEIIKQRNPALDAPADVDDNIDEQVRIRADKLSITSEEWRRTHDLTELVDDEPKYPDDDRYYFINVKPEFAAFADKVLKHKISIQVNTVSLPIVEKPTYTVKSNTLSVAGTDINVNAKTLEGLMLRKLLSTPNKSVGLIPIEEDYQLIINNKNYILTTRRLITAQKSINQKIRRKLHITINFISLRRDSILINPKIYSKPNN